MQFAKQDSKTCEPVHCAAAGGERVVQKSQGTIDKPAKSSWFVDWKLVNGSVWRDCTDYLKRSCLFWTFNWKLYITSSSHEAKQKSIRHFSADVLIFFLQMTAHVINNQGFRCSPCGVQLHKIIITTKPFYYHSVLVYVTLDTLNSFFHCIYQLDTTMIVCITSVHFPTRQFLFCKSSWFPNEHYCNICVT